MKIIVHLTDTELVKDEPRDKEKIIMLWVLQQFIALYDAPSREQNKTKLKSKDFAELLAFLFNLERRVERKRWDFAQSFKS